MRIHFARRKAQEGGAVEPTSVRAVLVASFLSVLRSLRLLQRMKMAFGGAKFESTFKKDPRIIPTASAEDFERALAVMGSGGSVIGTFTSPK